MESSATLHIGKTPAPGAATSKTRQVAAESTRAACVSGGSATTAPLGAKDFEQCEPWPQSLFSSSPLHDAYSRLSGAPSAPERPCRRRVSIFSEKDLRLPDVRNEDGDKRQ